MSLEKRTEDFMPKGDFNRETFVQQGEVYQDIGKWVQTLQKDPHNKKAFENAGKLFFGDGAFYSPEGENPRFRLEDTFSKLTEGRARYAEKKYSDFTDGLTDEHWRTLILEVPLYKTGNKEHDEIIEAIEAKRNVDEVSKDPNKLRAFLLKKSEEFDEPFRKEVRRNKYNNSYLQKVFEIYQKEATINYNILVHEKDGSFKKGLAKSIFESSLKAAKAEMNRESDEGDKSDIWEADIRPYYLTLDSIKYQLEKEKLKVEQNKKKDAERKERAKKRENMGMSH